MDTTTPQTHSRIHIHTHTIKIYESFIQPLIIVGPINVLNIICFLFCTKNNFVDFATSVISITSREVDPSIL